MNIVQKKDKFNINNEFLKYWKNKDYYSLYCYLNSISFEYKLETFQKCFKGLNENEIFNYLVFLLSKDPSATNVIFVCDYLIYMNPPFYDVYSVIGMFLRYSLSIKKDEKLIEWILITFEGNPDSPFSLQELENMKNN